MNDHIVDKDHIFTKFVDLFLEPIVKIYLFKSRLPRISDPKMNDKNEMTGTLTSTWPVVVMDSKGPEISQMGTLGIAVG